MTSHGSWFCVTQEFRLRSADRSEGDEGEVVFRTRLIQASDEGAARLRAVALGRADEGRGLDAEGKPVVRTFTDVLEVVESAGPDSFESSLEGLHDHLRAELAANRFRAGSEEG